VRAAAELFKTTGEPAFELAFRQRGLFAGGDLGASLADRDSSEPLEALWVHATTRAADPALRAACVRVIRERAESWIGWAERSAFRLAKHPFAPVGHGSITTPRDAGLLFRAHHLTGDERFRAYGLLACDVTLGGNWSGWSWVTGLGDQPVRHPLSNASLGDALDEPVPGIPVYGPSRLEESAGIHGAVIAAWDPPVARWPLAERFADVSYVPVLNEYTVGDSIALTAFAFGYVAVPPRGGGAD
jgi:endoglucanase